MSEVQLIARNSDGVAAELTRLAKNGDAAVLIGCSVCLSLFCLSFFYRWRPSAADNA